MINRFRPGDIIYRSHEQAPIRYLGMEKDGTFYEENFSDKTHEGMVVFRNLSTGKKFNRKWWRCYGFDADEEVPDWILLKLGTDDKVDITPLTTVTPFGYKTDDGVAVTRSVRQVKVTGYMVEVVSADGGRRVIQPPRKLKRGDTYFMIGDDNGMVWCSGTVLMEDRGLGHQFVEQKDAEAVKAWLEKQKVGRHLSVLTRTL